MSKKIDLGNIKIYAENSYEDMSAKAAEIFGEELKKNPKGVYGFATGSTPVGLYKELIKKHKAEGIDFKDITTFNLDEYYPIKKDNSQSYSYFMRENLFGHINIKPENINIPNGEADNYNEECVKYEEKIKNSGGIDLQILGIGENGHIGFNEPSSAFTKVTNFIPLTDSTINANARFFDTKDEVPKHALTMGIQTIMKAKKILLVVNSAKKKEVLKKALFGEITPEVPASILQLHPDVTVVVDNEAYDI